MVVVLLLAAVGAQLELCSVPRGIGIDSDSVVYIESARNMANGLGLGKMDELGQVQPLVRWPPLYPVLLGSLQMYGLDVLTAARYLGAFLFAAEIALVGMVLFVYTRGAFWLPVFGAAFILVSTPMLSTHSMAWSDPPFVLLGMLGLIALSMWLERSKPLALIAAALCVGLAAITRYAGVPLIATGALAILLWERKALIKRIRDAALFGAGGALPLAVLVLQNMQASGSAADRQLGFHPIGWLQIQRGLWTTSRWVIPNKLNDWLCGPTVVAALAGLVLLALLARRKESAAGEAAATEPEKFRITLNRLPGVLALFACVYAGFLIINISFVDAYTPLINRILLPIFPAALIFGLCMAHRAMQNLKGKRRGAVVIALALTGVALLYANTRRTSDWLRGVRKNGQGIEVLLWKSDGVASRIRQLHGSPTIYTNGPAAVSFISGLHGTYYTPQARIATVDGSPGPSDPRYKDDLAIMKHDMQTSGAKIVFLNMYRYRVQYANEYELKRDLPLRVVASAKDGTIYELAR